MNYPFKKVFRSKAGVIFGMEARIALVVLSIVSLALAINKLSSRESLRLSITSSRIEELKDNVLEYYKLNHTDLSELKTIYSASTANQDKFFSNSSELKYDGWGNEWVFKVFKADANVMTAFGEPVEPKCVVIFTAGSDGYHYLAGQYNAANYDDCINNVGLSAVAVASTKSDDMFFKFTTIGLEIEANKEAAKRLPEIQEAIMNYAEAVRNVRLKYCDNQGSNADSDSKCDIDGNNYYSEESDIDILNFYPKSSLDTTAAKYLDNTSYNNSNDANLEALLEKIGLPASYRVDLLGRKLIYNSNVDNATGPTYYASVKYKR